MADFTKPDELRARFAELQATRAATLALSAPLREQRDKIVSDSAKAIEPIDTKIRTIEAELFDLDQEAALISRALGGRTGS